MSSINVKPGKGGTVVPVKTVVDDGEHVPVYIGATSDGTLIDEDNPSQTLDSSMVLLTQKLTAAINGLITEQQLTNLYLSKIVDEDLRTDNELENR